MKTAEPKVSLTISVPLSTYVTVKTLSKMQRRSMNRRRKVFGNGRRAKVPADVGGGYCKVA